MCVSLWYGTHTLDSAWGHVNDLHLQDGIINPMRSDPCTASGCNACTAMFNADLPVQKTYLLVVLMLQVSAGAS